MMAVVMNDSGDGDMRFCDLEVTVEISISVAKTLDQS